MAKVKYSDTELLDYLQKLTDNSTYTGKVICRWSATGRGWRLHESSIREGVSDVREAIANMLEADKK